jgi:hypothetical protein
MGLEAALLTQADLAHARAQVLSPPRLTDLQYDFRLGEILVMRPLDKGSRPFDEGVTRKGVAHTIPG